MEEPLPQGWKISEKESQRCVICQISEKWNIPELCEVESSCKTLRSGISTNRYFKSLKTEGTFQILQN